MAAAANVVQAEKFALRPVIAALALLIRQIAICVPISMARSVGILKYCEASVECRASQMNSRDCQWGIPDRAAGRSDRRDK